MRALGDEKVDNNDNDNNDNDNNNKKNKNNNDDDDDDDDDDDNNNNNNDNNDNNNNNVDYTADQLQLVCFTIQSCSKQQQKTCKHNDPFPLKKERKKGWGIGNEDEAGMGDDSCDGGMEEEGVGR